MSRKPGIRVLVLFTFLLLLIFDYPELCAQDRKQMENLSGTWVGRIQAGAMYLRLVFNISVNNQDSLKASLESPDQGTIIIPMGTVRLAGDSIKIDARLIGARYLGVIRGERRLEGVWEQLGQAHRLDMEKQDEPFRLNRPQEPKPPFPYSIEEITFTNEKENFRLAGTLTIPEGKGPFPAAILISGSGQQNRDEELMGHKPFAVIADYLSRNGIAVLRYDDRGVGRSQGVAAGATSADFASDAEAAFNFLAGQSYIDSGKRGFIGHSEGGLIAAIVASCEPSVSWIVSLAGPGISGDELLMTQAEEISIAMGNSTEDVAVARGINKKLYHVIKKTPDAAKAETKLSNVLKKELRKIDVQDEVINEKINSMKITLTGDSYNWIRYFITTDPAILWSKIRVPVLVLNGEKDLQVNPQQNTAAIAAALGKGGNSQCRVVIFPGLNHLFQNCDTGLPGEYGIIEETFSEEVLKTISDWIKKQ